MRAVGFFLSIFQLLPQELSSHSIYFIKQQFYEMRILRKFNLFLNYNF